MEETKQLIRDLETKQYVSFKGSLKDIEPFEIKDHKVMYNVFFSETCFGCNGGSNEGIGMRTYITEDRHVVGLCRAKKCHQGFPDTIHGGIIGVYFDEVLWYATWIDDRNLITMTAEMNVKYLKPIHVDTELRVVARPARFEGRHIYVDGYILLPDDQVAATATIHYISVRKDNELNVAVREQGRKQQNPDQMASIRF